MNSMGFIDAYFDACNFRKVFGNVWFKRGMQVFVWFEVATQVCDGLRIDHGEEEITPLFCKKTALMLNVSPT